MQVLYSALAAPAAPEDESGAGKGLKKAPMPVWRDLAENVIASRARTSPSTGARYF